MNRKIPLALAALGCATLAAAQELNMKLGLWEITSTQETKGDPMSMMSGAAKAQMEEAKAHLSPEQIARMEAMIRQRFGPSKTTIEKRCLTKENFHQTVAYLSGQNSAERDKSTCKITPVRSTATVMESREVCPTTNAANSGTTLLFEAPNPETLTVRVESLAGGLEVKVKSSGKWLGPDCGNVKP
jgi:hypothetical protein